MAFFKKTIETDRLIIRPFKLSDLDAAYEMNLDPEVTRYTGDGGIVSKEELKKRIQGDVFGDYKKFGFGRMAVQLKGEDNFIGFAGLKYLPEFDAADLGFRFMQSYWGKGLATEAGKACVKFGFEDLNLEKILAFVLPENKASINVLKKLNFAYVKELTEDDILMHQYVLKKGTI